MITLELLKEGDSVFTVNDSKGVYFRYMVSGVDFDGQATRYFIFVQDKRNEYQYMGEMVTAGERISCRLTQKSTQKLSDPEVRFFNDALKVVLGQQEIVEGYLIRHERTGLMCRAPGQLGLF